MIFIGKVKSRQIKRIGRNLVYNFYNKFTLDFEHNKQVIQEITDVQSKRQRNMVAGYVTNLMHQIGDGKIQTLESLA